MITKVSKKIAYWLIEQGSIDASDFVFYEFAAYNIIFTSIPLLLFLFMCAFIGRFIYGMFLVIVILSSRKYSGGYHAKTPQTCMMISSLLLMVCLFISTWKYNNIWCWVSIIMSSIVLWILSPIDSPNRRLDVEEKRRCQFKSREVVVVWNLVYIISIFVHCIVIQKCIAVGMSAAGWMQLVCLKHCVQINK